MICICTARLLKPALLFQFVMCPGYTVTMIPDCIKDIQKGCGFQVAVCVRNIFSINGSWNCQRVEEVDDSFVLAKPHPLRTQLKNHFLWESLNYPPLIHLFR